MTKNSSAARLALLANRINTVLVLLFLPALPFLLNWYCTQRPLPQHSYSAILIGFYCCSVFVLLALWTMDKLLKNILCKKVFVRDNVRWIHHIQYCCGMISLICLPAAIFYVPLWFMVIIMAFLFLVVWVVAQVMDAAVTIREENDLTI
jgi:hypothetical protein